MLTFCALVDSRSLLRVVVLIVEDEKFEIKA